MKIAGLFSALTLCSGTVFATSSVYAQTDKLLSVVPKTQPSYASSIKPGKESKAEPKKLSEPTQGQGSPDASLLPLQGTAAPQSEGTPARDSVPAMPTYFSHWLDEAAKTYKANPSSESFGRMIETLRPILTHPHSMKVSPAVLLKDNPALRELSPKVIDGNGLKIWTFPKTAYKNYLLLQWFEVKQTVVGHGRRARTVSSTSARCQAVIIPSNVSAKDAGFVTNGGRHLLIVGEGEHGALWLNAYQSSDTGLKESAEILSSIPPFLLKDTCGTVSFRGSDLIFNVARLVVSTRPDGSKQVLPEAESATYKFWLRSNPEKGYVLSSSLPDIEGFRTVNNFIQAVQGARLGEMKSLLADARLVSIPKYLGLTGKPLDNAARIVQMHLNPTRGQRFRLINIGKDDLIFDVGKVKLQGVVQPLVKAIFIAPPDPFLQDMSGYFPPYSRIVEQLSPINTLSNDTKVGASPSTTGSGSLSDKAKAN